MAAAIENLKKKGFNIDFKLLQAKSNDEAMEIVKECDLVVDQLLVGWYGALAVEGMTFGKPVISFFDRRFENFVPFFKEIPIILANSSNIESVLEKIIKNPDLLREAGIKGRQFVEKHHGPKK